MVVLLAELTQLIGQLNELLYREGLWAPPQVDIAQTVLRQLFEYKFESVSQGLATLLETGINHLGKKDGISNRCCSLPGA